MTMIITQEQIIKATEASSIQYMGGGDKWKREVVKIGRAEVAEPAGGIPSYGVCDCAGEY